MNIDGWLTNPPPDCDCDEVCWVCDPGLMAELAQDEIDDRNFERSREGT